jgi:hypothetical protein
MEHPAANFIGILITGGVCVFIFFSLFFPIPSYIKNWIKPQYYLDPKTGDLYRMIAYYGYDKHSAVIAEMYNETDGYKQGVSDQFNTFIKGDKDTLRVLYGNRNRSN